MPTPSPLFIENFDTVRERLRLKGVTEGTGGFSLLEEAVRVARTCFYNYLDGNRISTLKAIVPADDPSTNEENLRALAEQTELKIIRMELMRTMPTMHFDSAPTVNQAWNDEGMLRGMSAEEIADEISRLETDIATAMDLLAGTTTMPAESAVSVLVVGGHCNPRPGSSILRREGFSGWA